jgi:3-hydroxyisobutyrate dehydrogenase-like beta-hydroxyacid dehydrogenase
LKVAYVGLGSMGAPQARLIARGGMELAVYDPYPPALEAFAGLARIAGSAADAARDADIACVCVRDDQQVEDVILGEGGLSDGLLPGSLALIHSTIRIDTLHRLNSRLVPRRIALVDAPVSRTRRTDDEPFVFTMMGGMAADVDRARAVVGAFSTGVDHIGPLGAGMATKIANNMITWIQIVVGTQATNLAASNGVPYEKLHAVLKSNGNLTPTMQAMLEGKQKVGPGENPAYDAFVASQAGIGEKDLQLAIDCCASAGLDVDMVVAAQKLVRDAMTKTLAPVSRPEVGTVE